MAASERHIAKVLRRKSEKLAERPRRLRRKPEAAEGEILDAAERFLRSRPFRDMTIDDIMSGTGLSRPSFYEYFRDRYHLVVKLAERLQAKTQAMGDPWFNGGDTADVLHDAMVVLVEIYATRGFLLQAIRDAASADPQAAVGYRRVMNSYVDATEQRIRDGMSRGSIHDLNAREVATALVQMNEAYLLERFGRHPIADPQVVAETMTLIWDRVLYRN